VPHFDARKALHDPSPLPRPALPPALPITVDVERIARRLARALVKRPDDEREILRRVYVDRLIDHLEEREPAHSPADAAIAHFIEVLQTP
jgi:hypothetical protein